MKWLLIVLTVVFFCNPLLSQGCSDAGFCSIGILKTKTDDKSYKQAISLGANYGLGEEGTNTINPYIEYRRILSTKWVIQAKLTAAYATGFLGNNYNLGDVYSFATYSLKVNKNNTFSILGGFKIPLTVSNDKFNGKPLPLDYQSSIGTYDFVTGINYVLLKKWEFSTGLQMPIIQKNKNSFFADEYTNPKAKSFASTNNFKRKSDALVRVGYNISINQKSINLKPNLLAIYHLGKDTYVNRFGTTTIIDGSEGLTLNIGLIASKKINTKSSIEIVAATPLIVRDIRADGLTRSAVVNLQYTFQFK